MYLFFDTETTGLPRDWNAPLSDLDNWPRLVQIAWLQYDNKGKELSGRNHIIKPEGFTIPLDASEIHGITTTRAQQEGIALKTVLEEFAMLIDKSSLLVAHNMAFDKKIVGAEFLRKGINNNLTQTQKICTMEESTTFCKLPGNYGYKWPKLTELHSKLFNNEFEEAHNAAIDITACASSNSLLNNLE